jgi:hypothetical protein
MNRLLVCLLAASALSAAEVKSVYLLPMAGGLDQFLANRLKGVYRVVTDPKLADAVFTDRLGEPFELKLAELFPEEVDPDKDDKDSKKAPQISSFGRGKGTIFLVDLKSRAVLWSSFNRSNGTAPDTLDRTANRIVQQLRKEQKPK